MSDVARRRGALAGPQQRERVVDGTPVDPPAAGRPGVAKVRIDGPPGVVDATLASFAAVYGDMWQPGTRKSSRNSAGDVLVYGTLIVPVAP